MPYIKKEARDKLLNWGGLELLHVLMVTDFLKPSKN